uniref:Uncharacterized protein n=1 Tax=Romanomermis culicivorax TaxID=13658 RepID=A0A915JLK0_ROMCU
MRSVSAPKKLERMQTAPLDVDDPTPLTPVALPQNDDNNNFWINRRKIFKIRRSKSSTVSNNDKDGAKTLVEKEHAIKNFDHLMINLELMHDRCITRNLQAAGLGGLEPDQEDAIYGHLDPNAVMSETGDSMLIATIKLVESVEKMVL